MKFRNKETGEIYKSLLDVRCGYFCEECPASKRHNKRNLVCGDFFNKYPYEAAAALGYEVIEDDAQSDGISAYQPIVINNYQNYQGNKMTLEWISVKDDMPKEHDSMFKKFKNTSLWKDGMFEKTSDRVIVAITFEDGKRKASTASTVDGKWIGLPIVGNPIVTHWMPFPELPKEENK